MNIYNPQQIEPKWQKIWEETELYKVDFASTKPKYYGFGMFNYPSGAGIHVGHVRNYTIPDIMTRAKRQQGFESYQPIGWDSFGLPAENYAIKTGVSPQESTKVAITKYQEQYRAMGWAVDWSKEINTTDPEYYKWTQWIFTKLFEAGLAYQAESAQWWCDQCKTVLADEQVVAGKCWRHEGPSDPMVTKRNLKQWFFKITEYADEILEATDKLNWTPSVKASQKSWIGKSSGANIDFAVHSSKDTLQVYTTRPDTIFGATFMVIAPEHELVGTLTTADQKKEVEAYIAAASIKTEVERQEAKEKTGVFTGSYAINPAGGEQMPIWVADYVLTGYGTGAIMAVPAHDERDNEFAKKYGLESVTVISQDKLINSGEFDGLDIVSATPKIIEWLVDRDIGQAKIQYKMRDWLISRQRYWGAPIPIIHCDDHGAVAVPEKDLPVILPEIENYQPTGENISVLVGAESWVNVPCPQCGKSARRETDTMDGYVCSSWYFLRYLDPHNTAKAWQPERADTWMPVDFYNGADHATAHLLYARFFTRFFHKLGLVRSPEPFAQMVYNGKVKASDGSAFSKTLGNGVDPLEVIEQGHGADALRLYEMFAAPVEQDVLWDTQGIPAMVRYLNRVWTLCQEYQAATEDTTDSLAGIAILQTAHKTIKKVTRDIQEHKFNTAIAALMQATNDYYKYKGEHGMQQSAEWKLGIQSLLQLLAPFVPHITEELWQQLGNTESIHVDSWPEYNPELVKDDVVTIVVQVNGKLKGEFAAQAGSDKDALEQMATELNSEKGFTGEAEILKVVVVPNRLVNFVTK